MEAWNVGVIESGIDGVFNNPGNMKIRWVKHKYRDRYFADPFLQDQDDNFYYILAEEYVYYEKKGKISRLTVEKKTMQLINKEIILNDKHHLSYPYILDDYIIPEGYHSDATYAYKKARGEVYQKIKLIDDALIDPTVLRHGDQYWIFATTKQEPEDAKTKLSIFYSNIDGEFVPHKKNPVKNDIKTSRPAGKFFEYKGKLFRPAQDSEKIYGHLIRILEVISLSEKEYKEQEVMMLSSEKSPPYNMGFHTFNVYDNCIIVDGYREYYSYILKPIFMKLKRLMLYINRRNNNQGHDIITLEEFNSKEAFEISV